MVQARGEGRVAITLTTSLVKLPFDQLVSRPPSPCQSEKSLTHIALREMFCAVCHYEAFDISALFLPKRSANDARP